VDTWRAGASTCCDVGDMGIGYVACGAITYCDVGDMAMEYVETKSGTLTWHIDTWHIDTWKSIGGIYQYHVLKVEQENLPLINVRWQIIFLRREFDVNDHVYLMLTSDKILDSYESSTSRTGIPGYSCNRLLRHHLSKSIHIQFCPATALEK
jgi:hypothetical protein